MCPPSPSRRRLLAAAGAGVASALAGCGSRAGGGASATRFDAEALREVRAIAVPTVPVPAPVAYPDSYVRERRETAETAVAAAARAVDAAALAGSDADRAASLLSSAREDLRAARERTRVADRVSGFFHATSSAVEAEAYANAAAGEATVGRFRERMAAARTDARALRDRVRYRGDDPARTVFVLGSVESRLQYVRSRTGPDGPLAGDVDGDRDASTSTPTPTPETTDPRAVTRVARLAVSVEQSVERARYWYGTYAAGLPAGAADYGDAFPATTTALREAGRERARAHRRRLLSLVGRGTRWDDDAGSVLLDPLERAETLLAGLDRFAGRELWAAALSSLAEVAVSLAVAGRVLDAVGSGALSPPTDAAALRAAKVAGAERVRTGVDRAGTGLARTAVESAGDSLGRGDSYLREFLDGGSPDDVGRAFAAYVDARRRAAVATPATDEVVAAVRERS